MKDIYVRPCASARITGCCALGRIAADARWVWGHKDQKRRRRQNPPSLSAAPHLVSARIALCARKARLAEISQKSGWCDDVRSSLYNIPIERPSAARHERLWRHDRLYDVFFELGMNDAPPEKGAGSAIFLHLEKQFPPHFGLHCG